MKVGDLAEHHINSWCWGVIVGMDTFEYEVFWMDGERSWVRKEIMVKKCP